MVSLLTISATDEWIRIDRTGSGEGNRTVLVEVATGDMTTLDHDRRIYSVARSADFPREIMLRNLERGYGPVPDQRPILKPTGRSDVVGDWKVEEFVVETPHMRITQWVAPSLVRFVPVFAEILSASAGPMAPLINLWMPDPAALRGVGVRTIIHLHGSGSESVTESTILSIRETALPRSLFEIPKDYAPARAPHSRP